MNKFLVDQINTTAYPPSQHITPSSRQHVQRARQYPVEQVPCALHGQRKARPSACPEIEERPAHLRGDTRTSYAEALHERTEIAPEKLRSSDDILQAATAHDPRGAWCDAVCSWVGPVQPGDTDEDRGAGEVECTVSVIRRYNLPTGNRP